MWLELERIRRQTPNLLTEVSLRVMLILIVCIMQMNVKPRIQNITDAELLYYMRPRRDSYVPGWAMVIIIVFVPLVLLTLPYLLTKTFNDTIQSLLAWSLALSINAFVTESTKLMIGRPRPDFFYRCFPTGTCNTGFICTGNVKDVIEGRKSFPSGHSSFAFCSLGYLSVWFCGRYKVISTRNWKGILVAACLLPLLMATAIAISRFYDNHHHWEDILAGSLLGFASSYFCYRLYYNSLLTNYSGYPYLVTERESSESIYSQDYIDDISQCCVTCRENISEYSRY